MSVKRLDGPQEPDESLWAEPLTRIEMAREQIRRADEGQGSEPWAVRELLTALDAAEARLREAEAERDVLKQRVDENQHSRVVLAQTYEARVAELEALLRGSKEICPRGSARYGDSVSKVPLTRSTFDVFYEAGWDAFDRLPWWQRARLWFSGVEAVERWVYQAALHHAAEETEAR